MAIVERAPAEAVRFHPCSLPEPARGSAGRGDDWTAVLLERTR